MFNSRFACEGLKRTPIDQAEKIYQLIKVCLYLVFVLICICIKFILIFKCNNMPYYFQVINRKFLRSKMVPILEETRKTIQDKVEKNNQLYQLYSLFTLNILYFS